MATHDEGPSRFDPRFDPKFQPGYDPQGDPASAARGAGRPASTRAVPEPGWSVAPAQPRVPDLRPTPPVQAEDAHVSTATGETNTPAAAVGRNPFVVALWATSVALLVAGFVVLQAYRDLNNQPQTSGSGSPDFALIQLLISLPPALFQLSLATMVGLLFFHAVVWRRSGRS